MQSNLGAYNHYVVAYGYEEYTYPGTNDTYDGFITNFGYGYDSTNIWINSSWICAYITMAVNHEHNYTSDGQITGTLRTKYRCTICGHRTDAVILNNTTSLKRYAENFTNMPLNRDYIIDLMTQTTYLNAITISIISLNQHKAVTV